MGRGFRIIASIIGWLFLIYLGLKKNCTPDDVISAIVFGVIIITNKIEDTEEDLNQSYNKRQNGNDQK